MAGTAGRMGKTCSMVQGAAFMPAKSTSHEDIPADICMLTEKERKSYDLDVQALKKHFHPNDIEEL